MVLVFSSLDRCQVKPLLRRTNITDILGINFWKFIDSIKGIQQSLPYETRCKKLADSGIALWDVLKTCTRSSSLDSDIVESSIVANDFETFLKEHSNVSNIYFNGAKAEKIYMKYVLPKLSPEFSSIQTTRLLNQSCQCFYTYGCKVGTMERNFELIHCYCGLDPRQRDCEITLF